MVRRKEQKFSGGNLWISRGRKRNYIKSTEGMGGK